MSVMCVMFQIRIEMIVIVLVVVLVLVSVGVNVTVIVTADALQEVEANEKSIKYYLSADGDT